MRTDTESARGAIDAAIVPTYEAAAEILRDGEAELRRLRATRGTHRRTARRFRRALAMVTLAAGLLGMPLGAVATAATPVFDSKLFLPSLGLLTGAVRNASPEMGDLDGDGDLDILQGRGSGALAFFENTGTDTAPDFAPPTENPFGLSNVGFVADPALADIDGDGDLDALVGQIGGRVFLLENTGTANAPAFAPGFDLGLVDSGGGTFTGNVSPALGDLDGDGDLDLLIGELTGQSVFLENTGTAASPAFAEGAIGAFGLESGSLYNVPEFADLDGDGDLDVAFGDNTGLIRFQENTGTANTPAFASSVIDPFGLPDVYFRSAPAIDDLDGDGDFDFVIGDTSEATFFIENTGSANAPAFSEFFVDPADTSGVVEGAVRPEVGDLDGDGDLDVLTGAGEDGLQFFENFGTPGLPAFSGSTPDPFGFVSLGRSNPTLGDIDDDGDLDLVAAVIPVTLFLYENTGSSTAPAFAAGVPLPIVPGAERPDLADLDDDGDLDLLVGTLDGSLAYRENTGTPAAAAFGPIATNPFGLTDVGDQAAPELADVDGDGDLDAWVGNANGDTVFFENTGSANAPAFAPGVTNPFGLSQVLAFADIAMGDFDDDGDLDGVIGPANRGVLVLENVAEPDPEPPPTALLLDRATAWPARSKLGRVIFEGTVPATIDASGGLTIQVTDGLDMDEFGSVAAEDCTETDGRVRCRSVDPVRRAKATARFKPAKGNPSSLEFRIFLNRLEFQKPQAGPLTLRITDGLGQVFEGSNGNCVDTRSRMVCRD